MEGTFDGVQSIAWSPDGAELVYERVSDGLWIAGRDGTGPRRLTTGRDRRPDWSPDGQWLAFIGDTGGLFEVTADGSMPVERIPGSGMAGEDYDWVWLRGSE